MSSRLLLILALGAMALPGSATADHRPVRNSFVDRRVANTAQLLAHVRIDPVVADRYERHFAMDRPTMLRFLAGLHRAPLARDGVYTIYSVPAGGRLKMHVGRIRRGEPMFMDAQGRPTLVVKCGNPVVLGPARPVASNLRPVPTESGAREFALESPTSPSAPDLEASLPATPIADVPTPTTAVVETVPVVGVSLVHNGLDLGFASIFLPILGEAGRATKPNVPLNPVPEPASLVALAVGALGLLRRRSIKRR